MNTGSNGSDVTLPLYTIFVASCGFGALIRLREMDAAAKPAALRPISDLQSHNLAALAPLQGAMVRAEGSGCEVSVGLCAA